MANCPGTPLSKSTVHTMVIAHWPTSPVTVLGDSGVTLDDLLVEIVRLESGYNPQCVGDGGESDGLFQIHWPSWGEALKREGIIFTRLQLKDPMTNMRAARFVYDESSPDVSPFNALSPWSTRDQAAANLTGQPVPEDEFGLGPGVVPIESPALLDNVLGDWMGALGKFFSVLTSVSFWKAVGLGALALLLIIVGVALFAKSGVQ